ncbi:RimK family alpha-L-glutamate ligase [Croceitalea rosinachiae]|uniref:RimK family alpha-L-glutamate ligase n=1 Tax=Croceitalea rosinachiae TaxID=3075596 RepID=A0ABU3AB77_9FLAO|nr:RimK family alpha-L-glutamate ligase [Croceitalea sp. F388]MDT0606166.1 RimK family alpha-L-glutamate ligase [Croceitalea sp. F388]
MNSKFLPDIDFLFENCRELNMDIALLSLSLNVHSTRRIAQEAEKLGHYVELIDHTKCSVKLGDGKPKIFLGEEDVTNEFDAIIPRIGAKVTRHGAAIVKQFEMNGVFSTARSLGITRARNKVRTLQIMARKGIPIPETLFSINPDNIGEQIRLLGGPPVIIKLQEGTQGLGVILAESKKSAKSIIDTFYKMDTSILLQKYVEEANGEDIRIIVVGRKVVASMKRKSEIDEFRSNVHRGGQTEAIEPTQREKHIALNATKYLGLGVAGVDLMRSRTGPVLIEVNASPGLKGIEAATGVNVAKHIIQFVEKNALRKRKK